MNFLSSIFATRQIVAMGELPVVAGKIIAEIFSFDFRRAAALIVAFFQLIGAVVFDTPVKPYKDSIDMSRFRLEWSDEFDNGFDTEKWQGHYVYGANDTQIRDTAWWNREQVSFTDDGCLKITAEYKENGPKGAGYYSYGMETNPNKQYDEGYKGYEQLYGYFEIRCIVNEGSGFWSAFWLQASAPYTASVSKGGIGGAEIDIFESVNSGKYFDRDAVSHNIHCAGVDGVQEGYQSNNLGAFYGKNIYDEYNTYGLEWNDEEYIFYINGVETRRTSFGNGVSEVPEEVIVSLEIPNAEEFEGLDKETYKTEYIIDYVKIYQK